MMTGLGYQPPLQAACSSVSLLEKMCFPVSSLNSPGAAIIPRPPITGYQGEELIFIYRLPRLAHSSLASPWCPS